MVSMTVPVPGAELHVEVDGRSGAPGLLLFSGAGCNAGMWTPVLSHLHFVDGAGPAIEVRLGGDRADQP